MRIMPSICPLAVLSVSRAFLLSHEQWSIISSWTRPWNLSSLQVRDGAGRVADVRDGGRKRLVGDWSIHIHSRRAVFQAHDDVRDTRDLFECLGDMHDTMLAAHSLHLDQFLHVIPPLSSGATCEA